MAIWSSDMKVGAWPTPAISTTRAWGLRLVISAAVAALSRSDCSPRTINVGHSIASNAFHNIISAAIATGGAIGLKATAMAGS